MNASTTPRGSRPAETRRSTKHKRPAYGQELITKHAARKHDAQPRRR